MTVLKPFAWTGGLTSSSINAKACVATPGGSVRLAVSTSRLMTSPAYGPAAIADADGWCDLTITGLSPRTQYWYQLEIDGVLTTFPTSAFDATADVGQFRTVAPAGVPFSFSAAVIACTDGRGHFAYRQMERKRPRLMIHMGDFFYLDNAGVSNDPANYITPYVNRVGQSDKRGILHQNVPTALVWDDHDFGADNSDGTSASKTAAATAYRQCVPHYPLVESSGTIYHAFTVGRVRFILTDLRYNRSVDSATDDASKTTMGATQKTWFKAELLVAKNANLLPVWVSSSCMVADATDFDSDHWGAFTTERTEIWDYCHTNGITNLAILCGDAHMLAAHSGVDYSTGATGPALAVFNAADVDLTGNTRDDALNPWTVGPYEGPDLYSIVRFTDTGSAITLEWTGFSVDSTTGAETVRMTQSKTYTVAAPYQNTVLPANVTLKQFGQDGAVLATPKRTL